MTELFGKLAPGATIDQARAELNTVSANMIREHPEAYSPSADTRISAVHLKEQITSGAKTVLLVLLASSLLIFVIACSNVANLILSRSVRREGELAIRAALGASPSALRRTLLAESLLMCTAGALLGILVASPMVGILAHYASRFSVRALDLTVDSSMLWVGAILAIVAAVLLAFVPRLPSAESVQRTRPRQRQRSHHRQHRPPPAHLRRHANRRILHPARRRQHVDQDFDLDAIRADRLRHPSNARLQRSGHVLRKVRRRNHQFLSRSHAPHRRASRRRSRIARHQHSVARRRQFRRRLLVHGRRPSQRNERRRPAREFPRRIAGLFRFPRRSDSRGPRFQ